MKGDNMYEVTVKLKFAAAHRVEDYPGNCERLHGHNWVVEVTAKSKKLDKLGMVIDFRTLKEKAKMVIQRVDHQYLNEIKPFDKINPTAENIAKWIFDEISKDIKVSRVNVYESDDSMASYFKVLK